jgi:hypothetical protein
MTLMSTPYFDLSCNGKLANLRQPDCTAVSEGGFDQEAVIKAALERGWTESGKGHKCPGCSYIAAAETTVAPTRKPRQKSVPIIEAEQFDGQPQ